MGPNGEIAVVDFIALDKEHYWVFREVSQVVGPGGQVESITDFLNSTGIQQDLALVSDVIVLGAASCETQDNVPDPIALEEQRAANRARQMVSWLRQAPKKHRAGYSIFHVNLGHYRMANCPDHESELTRHQRGAFLIAVVQKSGITEERELESLLKAHLLREDNALELQLSSYSLGEAFRLQLDR
jgi:hypothetical protein